MSFLISIFLCALSAGLYILSFPNFNLWFLAWVALVPFFFAISGKNKIISFLLSFFFGAAAFITICQWLNYISYTSFYTFLLALLLQGVYIAFFGFIAGRIFAKGFPPFIELFMISAAWTAIEYCKGFFIIRTGGWWSLAYSQTGWPAVIQIADITGYYGVSFLIVMANVFVKQLTDYFIRLYRKAPTSIYGIVFSASVVAAALSIVLTYGKNSLNTDFSCTGKAKVSIIQGNVIHDREGDHTNGSSVLRKYEYFTRLAAKDRPDLIVWPETALISYKNAKINLEHFFSNLARRTNTYILVGSPRYLGLVRDYFNSAALFDSSGHMKTFYDRQEVVPFGRFFPNKKKLRTIRKILGLSEEYEQNNLRLGGKEIIFELKDGVRFGVVVCFEDFFQIDGYIRQGADFLISLSNDSWFKKSGQALHHEQASVFRAVEYRIPLVRCSNMSVSGFIDVHGRVYGRVINSKGEFLMATGYKTDWVNFTPSGMRKIPFYSKYGHWFLNLCLIMFASTIIALFIRKDIPKQEGPSPLLEGAGGLGSNFHPKIL